MVSRSADVVREPVFWFFLSLGLYGFVTHFHRRHAALYLIGAPLAFLTAAWTRIEGIIVIPLALFFLAWASPTARIRRCLLFLLPIVLLIMAGVAVAMLTGRDVSAYLRTGEVMEKALAFTDSYRLLREQLQQAVDPQTAEPLRWFLPEARSTIWLVALGVLINRIAEGFFYPFVLIYLLGLLGIKSRLAADRRLVFVVVLIVSILALLYLHTLQTWMLFYRFIVFAILPSAVLAAFGADFVASRISRVTAFRPVGVLIGLGLLIVLVSLPKNLAPRDPEKNVFREIGRQAAAHRTGTGAAHIATTVDRQRWISFYANLDVELPPCPQSDARNVWGQADRDLARLIGRLKRQGMDFFLWEEKIWSGGELDLASPVVNKNLRLIGQWQHPDTGKMLLFKLTPRVGASTYRPRRQPSASKARS
jgi:hypothetical protein